MLQELSASRFPLIPSLLCRELATLTCVWHDGNFFFCSFLQLKFAQLDLEKCLFPQLWHPSKSGLCLSFPWIEILLSFFFFIRALLLFLLENLQSPSPLLLQVHELTMEHTSLWCQYWPWTVPCLLCVTSDLAQEPQAA